MAVRETNTGNRHNDEPIAFEDAALVQRFKRGDVESFGLLVAKYQDRVYNLVLRICGRPSIAEELAQEAFLKAMEKLSQFRGKSKFYTWLFRIAANLAISYRRRSGRIQFHSLSPCPEQGNDQRQVTASMAGRREISPPAAAMAAETNAQIAAALEELDDEFRMVLVLRDMEDMDYAQIGEVLDVPVGTVKSRLHRGRTMLREKLTGLLNGRE